MALFKSLYNRGGGYLGIYEPFVADVLKAWPESRAVAPETLRDELGDRFCIPLLPINTAHVLEVRAIDHHWIHRDSGGDYFPNATILSSVDGLQTGTHVILSHLEKLIEMVRDYARVAHRLDWSPQQANDALERFVEEFSFELATARHGSGQVLPASTVPDDLALTVVNGFARQAFARQNNRALSYLEEMVQGSMLANVLYFNDLGQWSENLANLTVYLDTTVALRVLGLTLDPLAQATGEMMGLFRDQRIKVRIFDHTINEMHGVMVRTAARMRNRRGVGPMDTSRMNRELDDAVVQLNLQSADIEAIASDLNRKLAAAGVHRVETPGDLGGGIEDVEWLKQLLRDGIQYKWETPLDRDVTSALAIDALRGGQECRVLADTPALFVTANPKLARLTQAFFKEDSTTGSVPHVITDVSMTTQLWIRQPNSYRDLPQRLLIAESHAALMQGPELWGRYLHAIEHQHDRGQIDDREVKALVYAMESRESFFRVTHGDPDSVDEETPLQVLDQLRTDIEDRVSEEIQDRVSGEVAKASAEVTATRTERDLLADEVAKKEELLAEGLREIGELQEKIARRRRNVGIGIAVAAAGAAVGLPAAGVVTGPVWVSITASMLMLLGVLGVGWGYRKDRLWHLSAVLAVGAVLAVPAAIKAIFFGGGA